ncbi:MAG: hypothetical protein GXZ08_07680 [Tissierellia bacterium]|nr:hypothetical protein [Tissierellia bacterium]
MLDLLMNYYPQLIIGIGTACYGTARLDSTTENKQNKKKILGMVLILIGCIIMFLVPMDK